MTVDLSKRISVCPHTGVGYVHVRYAQLRDVQVEKTSSEYVNLRKKINKNGVFFLKLVYLSFQSFRSSQNNSTFGE
jgi:hypothetical protein